MSEEVQRLRDDGSGIPAARAAVVGAAVAVLHGHRMHAGRLGCEDVAQVVAEVEAFSGRDPYLAGRMQQRGGMGLQVGRGVAAHHAGRTLGQTQLRNDRDRECNGLVGDDSPGHAAGLDLREQFLNAGKQPRMHADGGAVIGDEFHAHRLVACVFGDHAKPLAQQAARAAGSVCTHRIHRQHGFAAVGEHLVERSAEVRRGVGQGSIEIEQYGAHSGVLYAVNDVIHIAIGAEGVALRERVVVHADEFGRAQTVGPAGRGELGGADEARVIVGALGQQLEDVLRADDREQVGLGIAVDRGEERMPAGLEQLRASGDRAGRRGHMLEQFHAGHHVIRARAARGQVFGRDRFVGHLYAALEPVQFGDLERLVGQVDPADIRPEARHGFGEDAPAAADIQHLFPGERRVAVDPGEAERVDLVQRLEFAARVPPAMGELAEFLQLCGVCVAGGCHGVLDQKKSPAFAGLLSGAALLRLARADDFDFHAAVLGAAFLGLVARDRLLLAFAFGVDAVRLDALAHQVGLDGFGAADGELLVVRIGADRVGVADGDHHLKVDALHLVGEVVELALGISLDHGLVEVEQRVGGHRHFLGDGLGCRLGCRLRCGGRRRRGGLRRGLRRRCGGGLGRRSLRHEVGIALGGRHRGGEVHRLPALAGSVLPGQAARRVGPVALRRGGERHCRERDSCDGQKRQRFLVHCNPLVRYSDDFSNSRFITTLQGILPQLDAGVQTVKFHVFQDPVGQFQGSVDPHVGNLLPPRAIGQVGDRIEDRGQLRPGQVDGDEVRALAGHDRADFPVEPQRPRP